MAVYDRNKWLSKADGDCPHGVPYTEDCHACDVCKFCGKGLGEDRLVDVCDDCAERENL